MSAFFFKFQRQQSNPLSGNANLFSLLLLSMAIGALSIFAVNSLKERNTNLRQVEFSIAKEHLQKNINAVYNDPTFLNQVLLVANETESLWNSDFQEKLIEHKFVFPIAETLPENAEAPIWHWLGSESKLSYPWLQPCSENLNCPIRSKLVQIGKSHSSIQFIIELSTVNARLTGPINPKKEQNRIKISIERGMEGLALEETKTFCKEGYALQYFHTPPLSLKCRPLGIQTETEAGG